MWTKNDAVSAWQRGIAQAVKLPEGERRQAHQALYRERVALVREFQAQTILRRLDSGQALEESLVWFWFNHFNVYWLKGLVGAAIPSYVDDVLRPRVQGRFEDLLMAVLTHPAMLAYLDNVANANGRLNENLARELLELHTLGVDGGYTQADVQSVARVLTGLTVTPAEPLTWPDRWAPLVVQRDDFLFDPRRHDFKPKQVLGQALPGEGLAEVQALARLLANHPATARHVVRKLGWFLVGDDVPQRTLDRAAAVFQQTQGDLAKVMQAVLERPAQPGPPGRTFKDPMRWVFSAVELLRGGLPVTTAQPLLRWLQLLGQPLFGRTTPDGYSLRGEDWVSAGQLTMRFDLAREMVTQMPRMVDGRWSASQALASAPARQLIRSLDRPITQTLDGADDPAERLALLVSSPAFMFWHGPVSKE